jgi:hypothetical protein
VPTVFLQHTRMSSGGLVREQENPKVRGGVGIANPSGSIVLSYGPRHPATPFPRRSIERDHNSSRKLLNPHRVSSITFYPFFSTTKATPRFALIH